MFVLTGRTSLLFASCVSLTINVPAAQRPIHAIKFACIPKECVFSRVNSSRWGHFQQAHPFRLPSGNGFYVATVHPFVAQCPQVCAVLFSDCVSQTLLTLTLRSVYPSKWHEKPMASLSSPSYSTNSFVLGGLGGLQLNK